SRDFDEYRRRLAGAAPAAQVESPDRAATGRVQTEVQDRAAPAPSADRLTLTQPQQGTAGTAPEAQIAQQRQAQDATQRSAELSRNIEELAKLGQDAGAPAAPTAAP